MSAQRVTEPNTQTSDNQTADTEPGVTIGPSKTYPYYAQVDPRTLRATGNSREIGDIRETRPDLVTSMAEHGFDSAISVINVAPDTDGVLRVIVGYHRTAAAVAVTENENPDLRVGVLVHEPGTRREQLIAQGIENIHRKGYTHAEEASYYQQLFLEGLDEDAIARELSQPVDKIRAGRAVAASARTHAAAQQLPDIDLLTMAKLSEFADDEQVHHNLVNIVATNPGQLDYHLRVARRERMKADLLPTARERLVEQGYALIDDEEDPPEGAIALYDLVDGPDVSPIEPDQHASCPGRAAHVFVNSDLEIDIAHYCTDYAQHGHRLLTDIKIENTERQLREQGVRLVDPEADGVCGLGRLFAKDAQHILSPAEHEACPGHAAYVAAHPHRSEAIVHWVCADYSTYGHVVHTAPAARAERDAAYQAAERKRAKVNNAAWKDAKATRREWLATTLFSAWRKRKANDLPARVHHWLGLGRMLASDYLADAAPHHRYACTLLGLDQPAGHSREDNPITALLRRKNTTEPQAIMAGLAMVIGACEQHWDLKYTDNADGSWRSPSEDARFYFELLQALGYTLSGVEALINNPETDIENWPHLEAETEQAP